MRKNRKSEIHFLSQNAHPGLVAHGSSSFSLCVEPARVNKPLTPQGRTRDTCTVPVLPLQIAIKWREISTIMLAPCSRCQNTVGGGCLCLVLFGDAKLGGMRDAWSLTLATASPPQFPFRICRQTASAKFRLKNTNFTVHKNLHIPTFFVGMKVGKNIL